MDEKPKPTSKKKRAILIELPQEYADRLSKIANKENRSTKAQTEFIVMRTLDAKTNGTTASA